MICVEATKTYDIDFKTTSVGDGLWGLEADRPIRSVKLEIEIRSWNQDSMYGTARFTHNLNGMEEGLIYTDSVEKEFEQFLKDHDQLGAIVMHASGSEQGMQDYNVLDLDLDIVEDTTFEWLELIGYKVTKESYGDDDES